LTAFTFGSRSGSGGAGKLFVEAGALCGSGSALWKRERFVEAGAL